MQYSNLTRAALLLALMLVFQSLRLVIPLPPFFSTLIIGTLVNACLLTSAGVLGFWPASVIGAIAPIIAFFQQLLPIPVFIAPVAIGNILYCGVFIGFRRWNAWLGVGTASLVKALFMFFIFKWLLTLFFLPPKAAAGIMLAMSWPQFITAVFGGLLALAVLKRLNKN